MGLSVSRVGGAAQTNVMKKSVGSIRLDLAQYREMQAFSQFSNDLDPSTLRQLKYGAGLMQLLRQPNNAPLSLQRQVISLICAQAGLFVDSPLKEIKAVQKELLQHFELQHSDICHRITVGKTYSEELKNDIIAAARKFMADYK